MAQNITLKDKVTGEALYPLTSVENIYNLPAWVKIAEFPYLSAIAITANTSSVCTITGASNAGKILTIIYTNSTGGDLTVTVPTTYKTPDGKAIELNCPDGGFSEISYVNIGGTIYARGL